ATTAMATDMAPATQRVRAFGLFSLSTLLGFSIGPAVGEALLADDRFALTFVVCGVLALAPMFTLVAMRETKPATEGSSGGAPAIGRPRRPPLLHPAARRPGV